jgi:hypothetical protein
MFLTQIQRLFLAQIQRLLLLLQSGAPLWVFLIYLQSAAAQILCWSSRKQVNSEYAKRLDAAGEYTTRWNDGNFWDWLRVFEAENILGKPLRILEIGSWEGRSASFLLTLFTDAHIICVDTWEGSDEHSDINVTTVEERFNRNVSRFQGRIEKFKGSSERFFSSFTEANSFDLIYIDGSHFGDDVLIDAIKSYFLLKDGGILIFDDYLWRFYADLRADPIIAINKFLRLKRGTFSILSVTFQLVLKKTCSVSRERRLIRQRPVQSNLVCDGLCGEGDGEES